MMLRNCSIVGDNRNRPQPALRHDQAVNRIAMINYHAARQARILKCDVEWLDPGAVQELGQVGHHRFSFRIAKTETIILALPIKHRTDRLGYQQ